MVLTVWAAVACAAVDQVLPPLKPSSSATAQAATERLCENFEFVASKDVDTAYASAVGRFALRTPEERRRAVVNPGYQIRGDVYAHHAQPGALYRISDWANVSGFADRATWMRLELAKQSAMSTGVKGNVCWETEPGIERRRSALSMIRATL
jgi:hypothetical protein